MPSSAWSVLQTFGRTRKEIRSNSIDSIFLLSGALTLYGCVLLLYAKFSGKKTMIFFYGKDILTAKSKLLGSIWLWSSPRLASVISANSRYTAKLLSKKFEKRTKILYPSIDPEITMLVPALSVKKSRDKPVILFVGRLVQRKGVDDLLHALSMIAIPQCVLEIVGDGPEMNSLNRLAGKLNLLERVRFFGMLSGQALYERYSACDIFVMPSKTTKDDVEGFGTVFFEAGLFGKPSIGTRSGGIPEAIEDGVTGLLVAESNPKELSEAIVKLLSDPKQLEMMGDNARKKVQNEFTWEKGTEQLISYLHN